MKFRDIPLRSKLSFLCVACFYLLYNIAVFFDPELAVDAVDKIHGGMAVARQQADFKSAVKKGRVI